VIEEITEAEVAEAGHTLHNNKGPEQSWQVFGKVFEELISKRLNLAVDAADGLSPTQFGFRKGNHH